MTQLTKEHFDQQLKKLVSKGELDEKLKRLATKDDLKNLATKTDLDNLEAHVDAEALAIRKQLKEGFQTVDLKLEAIYEMLDVRQRMEKHEQWLQQLAKKTGVKLES